MPLDEQQKNTIVLGVTNVVRNTLSADVQRTSLAFRMLIDNLEPGEPIPLQPLVDYLIAEQKVPEQLALELCVILRSREDRLKVTFVMPEKLNFMGADRMEQVVRSFNSKQDTNVSWEKKSGELPKPGAAEKPGWQPDKKKQRPTPNRTKPLLATLALGVAGMVAFYGWRAATLAPPIIEVQIADDGLPCGGKVQTNGAIAICSVSNAWFDGQPPETVKAKADITKKALASQGVTQLQVLTIETNRVVLIR